jgi:hypothetical protein
MKFHRNFLSSFVTEIFGRADGPTLPPGIYSVQFLHIVMMMMIIIITAVMLFIFFKTSERRLWLHSCYIFSLFSATSGV